MDAPGSPFDTDASLESYRDADLLFAMDDTSFSSTSTATTATNATSSTLPAHMSSSSSGSEPLTTSLAPSATFEVPRGRTRNRSNSGFATQGARYARADSSSMCRGRTRRRSISPAPSMCTCNCPCSGCTAVALEICTAPHMAHMASAAVAFSPTRAFLQHMSTQSRRRDLAPCRDPECNKGRGSNTQHSSFGRLGLAAAGLGIRAIPTSGARARSRSTSRSRTRGAAAEGGTPMSAKSHLSSLRWEILVETGLSDEDEDNDFSHLTGPGGGAFSLAD